MEYVRFPLISRDYIFKNVPNAFEALGFNSEYLIPQSIDIKPRHGEKV